jgi:hypothetical protein
LKFFLENPNVYLIIKNTFAKNYVNINATVQLKTKKSKNSLPLYKRLCIHKPLYKFFFAFLENLNSLKKNIPLNIIEK